MTTELDVGLLYAGLDAAVEEPTLIERLRNGEPAAVGTVYDEHHRVIRSFAQRLLGDAAMAEDLVHEVFIALPKAIRRYRGEASLRTFLISIAVNQARHHVRAAARRRAAFERLSREPQAPVEPDPEHNARRSELARALIRALDALPLEQRVVFVLCDVEERTSAEVARIVSAPEPTVRTRLFHARKKLRAALEKERIA